MCSFKANETLEYYVTTKANKSPTTLRKIDLVYQRQVYLWVKPLFDNVSQCINIRVVLFTICYLAKFTSNLAYLFQGA